MGTVVYDEHHRIKYQNAVFTRTPGGSPPPYYYHPMSDAEAFWHHMKALQDKNLDQIMLDYTEESKFIFYDFSGGDDAKVHHYRGLVEIRKFFAWLCAEVVDE